MRLLHTSDWHLGHTLRDWPRDHEHEHFLAWLLDLVGARGVDALLISGDIFDTSNPSAAAQLLWYRFLAQARRRFPDLQIVAIGGNHDAAGRLEAANPVLASLAVEVVGALGRGGVEAAVERLVFPIGRGGRVEAWVAAVPFLRPADLPPRPEGDEGDPLIVGVREVYACAQAAMRRRRQPGQALVAMGHAYMVGGSLSELSERKVLGGNQHALPASIFDDDLAYVALGHLHLAQRVGARDRVRYAGSPLPLSMAEASYRHQVILVDLEGEEARGIDHVLVPRSVEALRVPPEGALEPGPLAEALRALDAPASAPEERWPFLDVAVELMGPAPGLVRQVEEALTGKGVRLVRVARHTRGRGEALGELVATRSLRDITPEEVFRERYRREHEGEPDPSLLEAFAELIDLAHQGRGA
jgi:exonuclease SbcD